MNSIVILIITIGVFFIGYKFYAGRIDKNIIKADSEKATPAKMYMDGVDFTPAGKNVLFGYQFKSIAALGPIIGPIIAVQWGWVPALLWIIFGTFFVGWIQDYVSAMISMRNDGLTFGGLSYKLISPRARKILLTFIYFYLLLIMGAFGAIVAGLLSNPKVPLGFIAMTLVGLLAGQMIYKWRKDIILTTVVTITLSFFGIWLGTLPAVSNFFLAINGGAKSPLLFGTVTQATFVWTIVTFLFCYFGAVLPIWRWAQPINYVAFWIVALGIVGALLGVLIWRPGLGDFPAFTTFSIGVGPLWPILFVTIACGAISGWHSLVSSSGTARQLEYETDCKPVCAGSMFSEMTLAALALIIATATFGGFSGYKAALAKGPGAVFAGGMGSLLSYLGVPTTFGISYGSVFLVIMAITIMHLVLRFMRMASAEFVGEQVPIIKNIHVGSIVGILLSILLVWTGWWQRIWVLFGGANQLMAALALLLATIWLMSLGKKYYWTLYPMIFMFVTTVAALLYTAFAVFKQAGKPNLPMDQVIGNIIAGLIALFLIIAALILAWDATKAIRKIKVTKAVEQAA